MVLVVFCGVVSRLRVVSLSLPPARDALLPEMALPGYVCPQCRLRGGGMGSRRSSHDDYAAPRPFLAPELLLTVVGGRSASIAFQNTVRGTAVQAVLGFCIIP